MGRQRKRAFYNNSFKKWLQENDITMYSTNNEGKFVIAERFIRTLKNKNYKYMTSKNVYIDKLDDKFRHILISSYKKTQYYLKYINNLFKN